MKNKFTKKQYRKYNKINVFDVANYIIMKSRKFPNNNLIHMKLHRLIYYSYIKYLLKYDKKIIVEQPRATFYGPLFDNLYYILKEYYEKLITKPLVRGRMNKLDLQRQEIIDEILELCKDLSGYDITRIAHNQAPQYETWGKIFETRNSIITDDCLKEYFSKKTNILETDPIESLE